MAKFKLATIAFAISAVAAGYAISRQTIDRHNKEIRQIETSKHFLDLANTAIQKADDVIQGKGLWSNVSDDGRKLMQNFYHHTALEYIDTAMTAFHS